MNKKIIIISIILIITLITIYFFAYKNTYIGKQSENETLNEVKDNKIQSDFPKQWQDDGIFSNYYEQAYKKLQTLNLDEKIGQLLLVCYPNSNQIEELKKYQFGGYLFFEKDFKGKTQQQVKDMIQSLQKVSKIPILTAVDEEGGTVVRISSNKNLANSKFLSPMELYNKRWI